MAQVDLAHIGTAGRGLAEVLDVDHAQGGELQRHRLAADLDPGRLADPALDLERAGLAVDRDALELELGAAVVEAGLVDLDAAVADRMVDLDPGLLDLAAVAVVDHDIAREQLGHAGRVVIDAELLELDVERQVLQQHAVGLGQDRGAGTLAFADEQVAAEGRVAIGQAMLVGHVGNHATAGERGLALEPGLGLDDQVAVEQAAQADQHDRTVRGQIAQLVGGTGLGGDHDTGLALLQLDLPAGSGQRLAHGLRAGLGRGRQVGLGAVGKGLQALLAHRLLVGLEVLQDLGRVARDAQAGTGHQESQDQQKPPGAIDRVELGRAEQLSPERAELIDIVVDGFVLLEHGADDRGNADDAQQGNREPHRRQQFHRGAQAMRAPFEFKTGGGSAHDSGIKKQARSPGLPGWADGRAGLPAPGLSCPRLRPAYCPRMTEGIAAPGAA